MDEKKGIHTDMNDRERARFGKQLRDLANTATEAAQALDVRDDTKFAVSMLILSMQGGVVKEMIDVLTSAIKKEESTEFPSIIDA